MKRRIKRLIFMLSMLFLLAAMISGCAFEPPSPGSQPAGTKPNVFTEGKEVLSEMEEALARWTPDRTDWSGGYLMGHGNEDIRDIIIYQLRRHHFAGYTDPMLLRESKAKDGSDFILAGVDCELDDFLSKPRWFLAPKELTALYEYNPSTKSFIPFGKPMYGENQPKQELEAAPDRNLTDRQMDNLQLLLDDVAGKRSFVPWRIRMQFLSSSGLNPQRNLHYYMDGYYLPEESVSRFYEEDITSRNGGNFVLSSAAFEDNGKRVQRWFVMPVEGGALYEYLPQKTKLNTIIYNDADTPCDFAQEKISLGEGFVWNCSGIGGRYNPGEELYYQVTAVNQSTQEHHSYHVALDYTNIVESAWDTGEKTLVWSSTKR